MGLIELMGLDAGAGVVLLYIGLVGRPEFRYDLRLSISELEGTRLGALSEADRKEWLEEEVLMDVREVVEVLDVTEELLEVDDLITPPRVKDFSLSVCVLVVPAICRTGLDVGEGCTVSFLLNRLGFEGTLGGVLFDISLVGGEGLGRLVLLLELEELEVESSSLVNVPWRTIPGFSWFTGD